MSPTGTTFRTRFPELLYQYVPIHEVGHYFGLNHPNHNSPRYIMWVLGQGVEPGETVLEYVFLTGQAIFSEEDAGDVWNWITTTVQARDTILREAPRFPEFVVTDRAAADGCAPTERSAWPTVRSDSGPTSACPTLLNSSRDSTEATSPAAASRVPWRSTGPSPSSA